MSMTFATDVIVNNGYKINDARIFYGTIGSASTDASSATKTVVCSNFKSTDLVKGAVIFVNVGITNTAAVSGLKMNVNSTGDKLIKCLINGALSDLPAVGYLLVNETYLFFYDGTNWVTTFNRDSDTTTTVTQSAVITTNGEYCILHANNTGTAARASKAVYKSAMTYNPSTKALTTGGTVNGYALNSMSEKAAGTLTWGDIYTGS